MWLDGSAVSGGERFSYGPSEVACMCVGEMSWRATNFLSSNQFPARPAETDYDKKRKENPIRESIPIC